MATAAEGVDTHQHVRTARSFLEAAEREFAAGDALQGSEKLWGAAAHAVLARACGAAGRRTATAR